MRRSSLLGIVIAVAFAASQEAPLLAQGMRFQADWLFLKRDGDGGSGQYITGSDPFSADDLSFDYESGYRLSLSGGTGEIEIEARFTRLDEWNESTSAVLTNTLVLDDTGASPFLPGALPRNMLNFSNALFVAATDAFVDGGAVDETLESEFLLPGASVAYLQSSELDDFELNVTTGRFNWFRVGLGYRNISFDELAQLRVSGIFDAIDVDDGANFGEAGNDPNDGLSDIALTEAGLALIAGGASPWDSLATGAGPDVITMVFGGRTSNQLNGIQGTIDAVVVDSEIFIVDFFGRLGLFHNHAEGRVSEVYIASENEDSTYARERRDSENDFAWAVSGGLRIALKLTDNLRVQTGYEAMFIDGLALGPDQVLGGTSGIYTVNTDGDLLVHGGRLGLEVIW